MQLSDLMYGRKDSMSYFEYQKVVKIAKTVPDNENIFPDSTRSEDIISYCARVSNPDNQLNFDTADKLIRYLIREAHWSPFEMVNVVLGVTTTRDIGRQMLRHGFKFQEFSGRYAEYDDSFEFYREARLKDPTNRQKSIRVDDPVLQGRWNKKQKRIRGRAYRDYRWALRKGMAKECARVLLPEGLTLSTMYVNGDLRRWMHYCLVRRGNGTQEEHIDIANKAWEILTNEFSFLREMGRIEV